MSRVRFQLSPEQQEVVTHREGHLQVVACAGSGKTEAIACRIATLVADGADPASIVAFTFTRRAAESLRSRISRRIGELAGSEAGDRLAPMFVGTIHAFCLRLLQTFVPEYGAYDVLDEHRLVALLSREYVRLGLGDLGGAHWRSIQAFLRNVDIVDGELIDPAELAGTPFGEAYQRYLDLLVRCRFLTYGQVIAKAVASLAVQTVFAAVHGPLRHLIVDEYQDVNAAQEALIRRLASLPVQLCVVGDDDQAIFQWRGSSVDNILGFTRRYGAASRLITVNRRSRPAILRAANGFARTIEPRHEKQMQTWRAAPPGFEGRAVRSSLAEDPAQEADRIAETILDLHRSGCAYRDIGILFRSVRHSAGPVVAALRARRIPMRCAGRTGLFRQPEVALLARTYAWLSGSDWRDEGRGHPATTLASLVEEYETLFPCPGGLDRIAAHLARWKGAAANTEQPTHLLRDYYQFLRVLSVAELPIDNPVQAARIGGLARFSQVLADFEEIMQRSRRADLGEGAFVTRTARRGASLYRHLHTFLQHYALEAYEDFGGEDDRSLDAVEILTVHQAKGLEWPVVFLPSLIEGRFPPRSAGRRQNWLLSPNVFSESHRSRYEGSETDERRLFYVAITRARDLLFLSGFERRTDGELVEPSCFLVEVAGEVTRQSSDGIIPPIERSGSESDVSATFACTDLVRFEQCPLKYRLATAFGFQAPPAPEAGYGKSLHHLIRLVAEQARATRRMPNAADIQALVREELYLPFAGLGAFDRLASDASNLLTRYVEDYADEVLHTWRTERPVSLRVGELVISGRADLMGRRSDARSGPVTLVDFKTTVAPWQQEIYSFQLVIYAAAARGEGLSIDAAYLHELSSGRRQAIQVDPSATSAAIARASALMREITLRQFPARPAAQQCQACEMAALCPHGSPAH